MLGEVRGFGHEMVHHVPSIKSRLEPVHSAALTELQASSAQDVMPARSRCACGQAFLNPLARKASVVTAVVVKIFKSKPNAPCMFVATLGIDGGGWEVVKVGFLSTI